MTTSKFIYVLAVFVPGGLPVVVLWLTYRMYRQHKDYGSLIAFAGY